MKQKKTNLKKNWIWLLVLAAILVAAAVLVIGNAGKNTVSPEIGSTTKASVETTAATELEPTAASFQVYELMELVDGQVQTPYGTLNYFEALADHLIIANTSTDPYTLAFYAAMEGKQEIRLFDISLGEGSGGNMGFVETAQGEVPLNVTIYSLTFDDGWTEGEIITAQAMQDVVNEMIDQMAPRMEGTGSTVPVISEQPIQADTVNNLEIMTPYCTMYYPARWGNSLRYEHDDSQEDIYKVRFYGKVEGKEVQLLFSVYFGGDEGYQLGAVMNDAGVPVPVNLVMEELNLDGWNETDAELLYSMQEASNQLIEKLPLIP